VNCKIYRQPVPCRRENRVGALRARNVSNVTSVAATIAAQPGPQTEFLRSAADICIYGGAAGGGKTVGLILEPLRYATRVANFTAVFFRRSTPQITNPGGLWDECKTSIRGAAACRIS
jgi:hypothetical protein